MNLSFIFSVCILSFILSSPFSLLIFKQLTSYVDYPSTYLQIYLYLRCGHLFYLNLYDPSLLISSHRYFALTLPLFFIHLHKTQACLLSQLTLFSPLVGYLALIKHTLVYEQHLKRYLNPRSTVPRRSTKGMCRTLFVSYLLTPLSCSSLCLSFQSLYLYVFFLFHFLLTLYFLFCLFLSFFLTNTLYLPLSLSLSLYLSISIYLSFLFFHFIYTLSLSLSVALS